LGGWPAAGANRLRDLGWKQRDRDPGTGDDDRVDGGGGPGPGHRGSNPTPADGGTHRRIGFEPNSDSGDLVPPAISLQPERGGPSSVEAGGKRNPQRSSRGMGPLRTQMAPNYATSRGSAARGSREPEAKSASLLGEAGSTGLLAAP